MESKEDDTSLNGLDSVSDHGIRVVCRLRPENEMEYESGGRICVEIPKENRVTITNEEGVHHFTFDHVFSESASQGEVYEKSALAIVEGLLEGYNGTIFAYGQTSSGKTYTMEGPPESLQNRDLFGIVPRAAFSLFEKMESLGKQSSVLPQYTSIHSFGTPESRQTETHQKQGLEFTCVVSFVEIYMERMRDLLDPSREGLKVREDRGKGVYVDNATEVQVLCPEHMLACIRKGASNRAISSTKMNEGSSRSHSVFVLTLQQKDHILGSTKTSRLYLVDLAGSEQVRKSGASGQQLEEAKTINKSLSALGNVIKALTDRRSSHIPYRDSKLTRLLQPALGGNSRTALVICVSPSSYNASESLSTLRFGNRAKHIKNKPIINMERSHDEIKRLLAKAEVAIDHQFLYILSLENKLAQLTHGEFVPRTLQLSPGETPQSFRFLPLLQKLEHWSDGTLSNEDWSHLQNQTSTPNRPIREEGISESKNAASQPKSGTTIVSPQKSTVNISMNELQDKCDNLQQQIYFYQEDLVCKERMIQLLEHRLKLKETTLVELLSRKQSEEFIRCEIAARVREAAEIVCRDSSWMTSGVLANSTSIDPIIADPFRPDMMLRPRDMSLSITSSDSDPDYSSQDIRSAERKWVLESSVNEVGMNDGDSIDDNDADAQFAKLRRTYSDLLLSVKQLLDKPTSVTEESDEEYEEIYENHEENEGSVTTEADDSDQELTPKQAYTVPNGIPPLSLPPSREVRDANEKVERRESIEEQEQLQGGGLKMAMQSAAIVIQAITRGAIARRRVRNMLTELYKEQIKSIKNSTDISCAQEKTLSASIHRKDNEKYGAPYPFNHENNSIGTLSNISSPSSTPVTTPRSPRNSIVQTSLSKNIQKNGAVQKVKTPRTLPTQNLYKSNGSKASSGLKPSKRKPQHQKNNSVHSPQQMQFSQHHAQQPEVQSLLPRSSTLSKIPKPGSHQTVRPSTSESTNRSSEVSTQINEDPSSVIPLELFLPGSTQITVGEGQLGVKLETDFYGNGAVVKGFTKTSTARHSINVGDVLIAVNGCSAISIPLQQVIALIRSSSIPRTLTFLNSEQYYAKLQSVNSWDRRDVENRPR